jgi:hypothetical protein
VVVVQGTLREVPPGAARSEVGSLMLRGVVQQ